mmetsp:Transcript_19560/g.58274  ORF Transcript_19560/g.58274 Transcript_19560/m.58274 type:complete len:255 (-) Transcript_19560:504-1268(-)
MTRLPKCHRRRDDARVQPRRVRVGGRRRHPCADGQQSLELLLDLVVRRVAPDRHAIVQRRRELGDGGEAVIRGSAVGTFRVTGASGTVDPVDPVGVTGTAGAVRSVAVARAQLRDEGTRIRKRGDEPTQLGSQLGGDRAPPRRDLRVFCPPQQTCLAPVGSRQLVRDLAAQQPQARAVPDDDQVLSLDARWQQVSGSETFVLLRVRSMMFGDARPGEPRRRRQRLQLSVHDGRKEVAPGIDGPQPVEQVLVDEV